MRVCYLTSSLNQACGWGRFAAELIYHAAQMGTAPLVLTPDSLVPSLLKNVEVISDPSFSKLLSTKTLRMRAAMSSCDIVHCLTESLVPLTTLTNKPCILNLIGTYSTLSLASKNAFFYRHAYHKAASLVSISNYTAKRLITLSPKLASKITVIPPGVSDFFLSATGQDLPFRKNALLFVGHVKPRKGLLELLLALNELKTDFPQLKLFVAGPLLDSKYLTIAQDLIAQFSLQQNVIFLNQISDIDLIRYLSEARALVLPSTNKNGQFEGFGLVHLEAHALGTPSIGSLDCGNEDAIKDTIDGYLVKQNDTTALSQAIRKILDDNTWLNLSKNAKLSAQEFAWPIIIKEYENLYTKLMR